MGAKKSSTAQNVAGLTKEFLVQQLQGLEKRFDGKIEGLEGRLNEKIDRTRTLLESKIEYSRKDASEQINAVGNGLNKRIDTLELKVEAVGDNLKFVRSDVKEIKQKLDVVIERVDRHDEEITSLKSAVGQN